MRRLHLLTALLFLLLAACARAPQPDASTLAKGQHLSMPFKSPGRCFGKPSKCVSDGQCAPPFSVCQEGACCSGTIDPVTCECRCGNGPACGPRELCCNPPASSPRSPQETPGSQAGLRCRPARECFGGE
jgi:hypothetical protein